MMHEVFKKHKKSVLGGIACLVALVLVCVWFFIPPKLESEASYHSHVASIVRELQSNHEDWVLLFKANGDLSFVDYCSPIYATKFRQIGESFVADADQFAQLKLKEDLHKRFVDYPTYVTYFTTYKEIGEQLIAFADQVDAQNIDGAVAHLERLVELNQAIPEIY